MTDNPPAQAAALQDRYTLERPLGRGGMATVYPARDLRHGREVALKVLRPDLAATLGPDRFRREIQTAARLQHPHICTVYDSGESSGLLWYTMPYVRGESVRDRLTREGRPSRSTRRSASPPRRGGPSTALTGRASSTGTSSPRTCCSPARATRWWRTSGSRERSPRPAPTPASI